ncbi:MAG TPA: hypothetical protein VM783_11905, partial [Candidatus Acidoferrum sp.]|nr:hypothetical protein [Candidatus Acidoferrum sp.]
TEAANLLRLAGFEGNNVIILSPGTSDTEVAAAVPTEDAEQPGMGKAIGSVIGGAVGLGAGALIANLLLPGIGPVLAVTFGAAAGGLGGAAAGAAAGGALENILSIGVPKDEIFFYEDALRQGRSVIIGLSEDDDQIEAGREALQKAGAETLDAAREKWWIGLRDAEAAVYSKPEDFAQEEDSFRCGFSAALEPKMRGRSFDAAMEDLKANYSDAYQRQSFRRGFERGQHYHQKLSETGN